jgi:hypothetical protein
MKPITAMKPAYTISLSGTPASGVTAPARGDLSYADELRALGQALEDQGLVSFELQVKGSDYLVRGLAHAPREAGSCILGRMEKMFASALWGKSGPPLQVSEVVYQFPPERIWQLHRDGRKKRVDRAQTPDPRRLSQLLRSTGCYLDRKLGSSLSEIAVKDHWLTVSYVTTAGRIERTKAALDFFYDHWIKMYSQRRDLPDSALRNGRLTMIARD